MSHTLDDSSSASHPGQILISVDKFLTSSGVTGIKRKYYAYLFKKPVSKLPRILLSNRLIRKWIRTSEHFLHGCINPSIIINKDKGIIATYTDLNNDSTVPTSVIKITSSNLHLIEGMELSNGQKIPTVSLYYQNELDPGANAWKDFEPLAAYCFSDNFNECDQLLSRLEGNEWECLMEGLKQVDDSEKIGLYRVNLPLNLTDNTYAR